MQALSLDPEDLVASSHHAIAAEDFVEYIRIPPERTHIPLLPVTRPRLSK